MTKYIPNLTLVSLGKRVWLPFLIYALLSIAILGPLFRPGYILTLDMIQTPNMDFGSAFFGLEEKVTAILPFELLQQFGGKIIPGWLFQKIILFLFFFLSGVGAHQLLSSKGVGSYFAGVLYMINPFIYIRLLAGQWGVLGAYAFTPFAIKAFIGMLNTGDRKAIMKLVLLSTIVGLLQLHGFFLLLLVFAVLFLLKLLKERKNPFKLLQVSKLAVLSVFIFLAVNLYWLVPVFTTRDTLLNQIEQSDLLFFAPQNTSTFGIMFDVASLHGFWRTGYIYAKDFLPFWWLFFIFILFFVVYGVISSLSKNDYSWIIMSFTIIGIVSFLLAVGASTKGTRPLFDWLWNHVPFFRGFRDSQKFVALLCLVYAYLGGQGLKELIDGLQQVGSRLIREGVSIIAVVSFLIVLAYSFPIFGFWGQLGVTDYPNEWYGVNNYLKQDKGDFNVLFLPWHMYMDFGWLPNRDKRLVNPAQQFFEKPIIAGDNIEIFGTSSQSNNPISKYVQFLLENKSDMDNVGELLAPLNVKYVILVNEADFKLYDFLYHQKDLTVVLEKPGIILFKNEHFTARVYAVDNVVHINNLQDYLELSKVQDVMEHLYVMGDGLIENRIVEATSLPLIRKSPVQFQIEGTTNKYTVFTVSQNVNTNYWEYNGNQPSAKNLGFMPAFASSQSGGDIVYKRFYYVYLPSYIISLITLLMIILYCIIPIIRARMYSKRIFSAKSSKM